MASDPSSRWEASLNSGKAECWRHRSSSTRRLTDFPKYYLRAAEPPPPLQYLRRRLHAAAHPPSSRAGNRGWSNSPANIQSSGSIAEGPLRKRGMVLRYDMWCWTSESSAPLHRHQMDIWRRGILSPLRVFGSGVLAGLNWTPKWMWMKARM
jgi:hypothetical protein